MDVTKFVSHEIAAGRAMADKQKAISAARRSSHQTHPAPKAPPKDVTKRTTGNLSLVTDAELARRAAASPNLPDNPSPDDYATFHKAREARAEIMRRTLKGKPIRV
jgi:hypothetical protein